jgi:threonine dehydratase
MALDLTLVELTDAAEIVRRDLTPTPLHAWPLLAERLGCQVFVKHENHTETGAFKLRGGLLYMRELKARMPDCPGVIAATRGNHGQSVAVAAGRYDLDTVIVAPEGNNPEKNRAMKAQGAELIVHGEDFQAALEHAEALAAERGLFMVPSFDTTLVRGVASYGLEMFQAAELDAVYVPIGLGSGICGVIAARDALGLTTEVIGVQAEGAPSYALSFEAGHPVSTSRADTYADGVATRVPVPEAVAVINEGAARIVTVPDQAIQEAQAVLLTDTHNLAEPAGAAPLAALTKEEARLRGKRAGIVMSGGNADAENVRRIAEIAARGV